MGNPKVIDAKERFLARGRRAGTKRPKRPCKERAPRRDPLEVMTERELRDLDDYIESVLESVLPPRAEVRFLPGAEYEEISFDSPFGEKPPQED